VASFHIYFFYTIFTGKIRAMLFIYTRLCEKALNKGRKIQLKVGEIKTITNLTKFLGRRWRVHKMADCDYPLKGSVGVQ
jgi:hypothetical protein